MAPVTCVCCVRAVTPKMCTVNRIAFPSMETRIGMTDSYCCKPRKEHWFNLYREKKIKMMLINTKIEIV